MCKLISQRDRTKAYTFVVMTIVLALCACSNDRMPAPEEPAGPMEPAGPVALLKPLGPVESEDSEEPVEPKPRIQFVGDTLGNVHFDSVTRQVAGMQPPSELTPYLDIDDDGEVDLHFTMIYQISPGGLRRFGSEVKSLGNKFEISCHIYVDSLRSCYWTDSDTVNQKVVYNSRAMYDCADSHMDSLITDYTVTASAKHSAGDKFDAITCWQSTKYILAYIDRSRSAWTLDDISYFQSYKVIDGDFIDGDRGYLAVRKEDEQGEYLYGWVELEVLDDFMNVFAHSYAMELAE